MENTYTLSADAEEALAMAIKVTRLHRQDALNFAVIFGSKVLAEICVKMNNAPVFTGFGMEPKDIIKNE